MTGALLPVCSTNCNVYTNRLSIQQLAFIQQEQCDDRNTGYGTGKEEAEKGGRECKENKKKQEGTRARIPEHKETADVVTGTERLTGKDYQLM